MSTTVASLRHTIRSLAFVGLGFTAGTAWCADLGGWEEGVGDRDGATRIYYNAAARLSWTNPLGDWVDATGKPQGDAALDQVTIHKAGQIELDVSDAAREWHRDPVNNRGVLLRAVNGGTLEIASRESDSQTDRPVLEVVTDRGTQTFTAVADTHLDKSTLKSLGRQKTLKLAGAGSHVLVRFDIHEVDPGRVVRSARLRLHVPKIYGKPPVTVAAFVAAPAFGPRRDVPIPGIASGYVEDKGLESHPGVYHVATFESDDWKQHWGQATGYFDTGRHNDSGFSGLSGQSLRISIAQGKNLGINAWYLFAKEAGEEPERVYFRYYLRLGDDWRPVDGGKLPGIAGTYDKAGWGGRKATGDNGWSARGLFEVPVPKGNIAEDHTPVGFYAYSPADSGNYGSPWHWDIGQRGTLEKNRWYCIEQFIQLNTPGQQDGIVRAWVDGRLAFEREDVRFRDTDRLKIDRVWLNVYHGGTTVAKFDSTVFVDNLVISREYVGPMVRPDANGVIDMKWWFDAR